MAAVIVGLLVCLFIGFTMRKKGCVRRIKNEQHRRCTGGLSCPQPVLVTMDAMKDKKTGQIVILVDTDTSKENVSRAAKTQGWQVTDVQKRVRSFGLL